MSGSRGVAFRRAVRHRPWQALVLALLATLVTTAATFAPLYTRAVEQAVVDLDMSQNTAQVTGLQLRSAATQPGAYGTRADVRGPVPLDELGHFLPDPVRRDFRPAVSSQEASANVLPIKPGSVGGAVLWRSDICEHLRFSAGRCPRRAGEIAVSAADVRVLDLAVGGAVRVGGIPTGFVQTRVPVARLHVVGVYRQVGGDYWFGRLLAGKSGIVDHSDPNLPVTLHDDWVTDQATFDGQPVPQLPGQRTALLLPPDPAIDVDAFRALGPELAALDNDVHVHPPSDGTIEVYSGLPDLVDDLNAQRGQVRVTVPLLMIQVGLLALFVLWLVLGAVTDQRRPEVALALLRGRGRPGARRLVLAELLPVTLVGVPLGMAAAVVISSLGRHLFLPGSAPFELTGLFWLAALACTVMIAAVTAAAVHRVTRSPVQTLLRRVGDRRPGWRIGSLDTLLIAACGTTVIGFATGGLRGSAELVGPAVLALLVGLVLAHLTMPVAAVLGRRALGRGRVAAGLSILEAGRSPATRRTVAMVTVATALLVFSADAVQVGHRNRDLAASQAVGAPRVLTVDGNALSRVRSVLDGLDPKGVHATPVVSVRPPGTTATTTLAVVPGQFRRIAAVDGLDLPLSRIRPPAAQPFRITSDRISVPVLRTKLSVTGSDPEIPVDLLVRLVYAEGGSADITLGHLSTSTNRRSTRATLSADVSCRDGCLVAGIGVSGSNGTTVSGSVTLGAFQLSGGRTTELGPASRWAPVTSHAGRIKAKPRPPQTLKVALDTQGSSAVMMPSTWFPTTVPAIVAGALPPGSSGDNFQFTGLDGQDRSGLRVARADRLPSGPRNTALVNLDTVQRGSVVDVSDQIQVWLADDSSRLADRVTAALARQGVHVVSSVSIADQRRTYAQSAAAWSLELGVLAGLVGLLVGIAVLLVVAVAQWRLRSYDLAAVRMAGLDLGRTRSIAVAGQLIPVLLAVVAGTISGLVGAQLALGGVPMFTRRPAVSTLDLSTAWTASGVAAVVALVALAGTGWLSGRALARRATLDRLRESL